MRYELSQVLFLSGNKASVYRIKRTYIRDNCYEGKSRKVSKRGVPQQGNSCHFAAHVEGCADLTE